MFCSLLLRRIVVGLLVSSLLSMLACQGDPSPEIVSAESPPATPDTDDIDDSTRGSIYTAGSAYHETRLNALMNQADVSTTVASFDAIGYEFSGENSFTIEAANDDLALSATFIAMLGRERSANRSVTVACFESGDEFGIVPAVFSAHPPKNEGGWIQVTDGIWIQDAIPAEIKLSSQRFLEQWSWDYFLNCMARQAPGVAVGCTLTCVGVPGFVHCYLICVAGQALAVTVQCLIDTYFYSRSIPKEQ